MLKKILVIVIVIVAIIILIGLMRQIASALSTDRRLNTLLEDVAEVEKENKNLKKELATAETYESVEEVARNNLNMSFPDETVIIVPESVIQKVLLPEEKPIEIKPPNWEGWLRLFTH